jgi:hypothetical protein
MKTAAALGLSVVMLGCAGGSSPEEAYVAPDYDDKSDSWSDFELSLGDLDLILETELFKNGDDYFLQGVTSIQVGDGTAFVRSRANADPVPIGQYETDDGNHFALRLSPEELGKLTAGATLYMDLPALVEEFGHYVVEIRLLNRVTDYRGTVNPMMNLEPVWADGRVSYRLEGRRSQKWWGPSVALGYDEIQGAQSEDRRAHFNIPQDIYSSYVGTRDRFDFIGANGDGRFTALVADARLRSGPTSASEIFVSEFCWNGTKTCLQNLPEGTSDTGVCASAIEVMACHDEVGTRVTEELIEEVLDANPLDGDELLAIVGADRFDEYQDGVQADLEALLFSRQGAWYLDEQSARESLQQEVELFVARAYSFPFEYVEPLPQRTGDPAVAPDVAADALLLFLPTFNFVRSEFTSTLLDITRRNRDEYVDILRHLRNADETGDDVEPFLSMTVNDNSTFFMFSWLGAHVELLISADQDPSLGWEID